MDQKFMNDVENDGQVSVDRFYSGVSLYQSSRAAVPSTAKTIN